MYPDRELNRRPPGLQPCTQSTELPRTGRFIFFFYILLIILDGGEGRKRGRETSICGCLSCTPPLGIWPATQACALTGNRTSDSLVHRPELHPLSHTSQGNGFILINEERKQIFFPPCLQEKASLAGKPSNYTELVLNCQNHVYLCVLQVATGTTMKQLRFAFVFQVFEWL